MQQVPRKQKTIPEDFSYELVPIDLDSPPPYETVSYVWGDQKERKWITMVDHSHLAITKSLHNALPYLLARYKTGFLWIDQMCIDQSNLAERSAQVSIMDRIYSRGSTGLIWLGHESEDTELLQDMLMALAPSHEQSHRPIHDILKDFPPELLQSLDRSLWERECFDMAKDQDTEPFWQWLLHRARRHQCLTPRNLRIVHSDATTEESDAECEPALRDAVVEVARKIRQMLYDLLARPWFTRVWILQEVCLAHDNMFLIGSQTFTHQVLDFALGTAKHLYEERHLLQHIQFEPHSSHGWATMTLARRLKQRKPALFGLYEVLCTLHEGHVRGGTRCTDSRDLIYGIMGLCEDRGVVLVVDYKQSLHTLMIKVFRAIIERRRDLDHLSICNGVEAGTLSQQQESGLPSWVPDWTRPRNNAFVSPIRTLPHWDPSEFPHRGNGRAEEDNRLRVLGREIGQVSHCFPVETYQSLVKCYATVLFGGRYCNGYLQQVRSSLAEARLARELEMDESRLLQTALHWACFQGHRSEGMMTWGQTNEQLASILTSLYEERRWQAFPPDSHVPVPRVTKDAHTPGPFSWLSSDPDDQLRCEHGKSLWQAKDGECEVDCDLFYLRAWREATQYMQSSEGRAMLLSAEGKCLIATPNACPGDRIYILHGCRYPVLLRNLSSGEYSYVGGCFIEGGIDKRAGLTTWPEHKASILTLV
ncbi:hypothetical protein LTR97_006206 [Elasticomyces elasticus]|uniref:Heterokaryon incompatibility domain-containing protein n=1 Tax=Elasticomyces elasticus TaxID=574655 RepID=A0AAN8A2F9_9PEZI|nr:hypothetical protein LTR97_006206 [Elasticomyces elasticus]